MTTIKVTADCGEFEEVMVAVYAKGLPAGHIEKLILQDGECVERVIQGNHYVMVGERVKKDGGGE